ncbi:MAG TPA: hypothetical protein VG056_11395 [Pirellulales bacterium]|nr:hypothetical protein [Pirellulales bacterium]
MRTLFLVMTAICVWLGWESHVVRERKAALVEIKWSNGFVLSLAEMRELTASSSKGGPMTAALSSMTRHSTIPSVREWLGDEAIASITLSSKSSEDDVRRIATLFPEAHVGKPQYSSPFDSDQVR